MSMLVLWLISVYGGNLVTRRHCKLLVIINWCHAHSTAGKKDELETEIVTGFCPGNHKEYKEVLRCWLFKKKKKKEKKGKKDPKDKILKP